MTSPSGPPQATGKSEIDSARFDFSLLVGHSVTVYSDQFPGKPLKTKIILANDREVLIDRSGSSGLIDNLVNNQPVTIRVDYKGQQVAVPATLKRSSGGSCKMILGEKVVPLQRRRFVRVPMALPVKLAVVPEATFDPAKLAHLRWIETITINLSPGGALLDFSSCPENSTLLLMNISPTEFPFPTLVLGQVRYSLPGDIGHFQVGVEFFVREMKNKRFRSLTLKRFPPAVFEYSESKRNELNHTLQRQVPTSADEQQQE